jgi:hypothetical protein
VLCSEEDVFLHSDHQLRVPANAVLITKALENKIKKKARILKRMGKAAERVRPGPAGMARIIRKAEKARDAVLKLANTTLADATISPCNNQLRVLEKKSLLKVMRRSIRAIVKLEAQTVKGEHLSFQFSKFTFSELVSKRLKGN